MAITRQTEPWSALLEAGRADERLVREAYEGARAPAFRAGPRRPASDRRAGPGQRRDRPALQPPGPGAAAPPGRPDDRHHRHRVGQVAVLQPADARRAVTRRRRRGRCTSTRPRRSPRTRPARCNAFGLPKQVRPAIYDGDTPREERAAIRRQREPRAHQPRHAARRDPAQPRARGRTSSPTSPSSWSTRRTSTAACSARTSANVLRRLRRVAAAYGTDAAVPARQRDDRQPASSWPSG